jgi:hypothetical protein
MFQDLPLHDATLLTVTVSCHEGSCSIEVEPVGPAAPAHLRFVGVTEVYVPREQPWGPSVSINVLRQAAGGEYELELQSGDVVRVKASSWSYVNVDGGEPHEAHLHTGGLTPSSGQLPACGLQLPLIPFTPRSALSLMPGMFWAVPLRDGSYSCGLVIQTPRQAVGTSRVLFLAGLLDWHSSELPNSAAIQNAKCIAQGTAHIKCITETGGQILGLRSLELERIEPWEFRGAKHWKNSFIHNGLIPVRPQTADDQSLPVLGTWGFGYVTQLASRRFLGNEYDG